MNINQSIDLSEQFNLAFIKKYLRINSFDQDELIEHLVKVAIEFAENYLRISIAKKNKEKQFFNPDSLVFKLDDWPLSSIHQIKLHFPYAKEQILALNEYRVIDNNIYLNKNYLPLSILISYQVGFEEIPSLIKHGILQHVARLYEFRGDELNIPQNIKELYNGFRKVRF